MKIRTYTDIGKENGYTKENIDISIKKTKWRDFRTENLPFCQGECIKQVIKECKLPLSKISKMDLHNGIDTHTQETVAFYALDVKYKNGQAQVYIADNGCLSCVVATDFREVNK